jgi:hypothetical protein
VGVRSKEREVIQVDTIDEQLEARMRSYASQACGALDDMRGLARDVGKSVDKGGLPTAFQRRATELLAEVEAFEIALSDYAVQS